MRSPGCPKQKIVATGDIVVSPIPFGFGSYSGDWIDTIGKIKALGFATLIPGHGLPQRDSAYLDRLVAALSDLRGQIAPLAKAGMPLEEVRKKVDFSKSIDTFRNDAANPGQRPGAVLRADDRQRLSGVARPTDRPRRGQSRARRAARHAAQAEQQAPQELMPLGAS